MQRLAVSTAIVNPLYRPGVRPVPRARLLGSFPALRIAAALGLLAAALALAAPPADAQATVYVTDVLTIPLRSGPSNAHRILHSGLESGTALQVLERDEEAGFTRVRMSDGTEGWLRSQYLTTEPIARDRLESAEARAAELQQALDTLRERLRQLEAEHEEAENRNEALAAELRRTEAELNEVRNISSGALEQQAENEELRALNERLRDEVEALIAEIHGLEGDRQQRWLFTGGGLLLGGLLLGLWLKPSSRRGGW